MTSIEKRRSGRKSGSHRKHSDGGYSDTSSGGSFLDENDREVSSLTDRAFRSLCIGDEAVYNDSDLSLSSPCTQRDRQLAFSHGDQDREDRHREELKRAAHENFSRRVQQYGQDWVHGGMCGAEIHRDPQWEVNKDWTHGRVSATFQHSYVETTQQAKTLREEQLSFLSNGATELSSQQRRSRSRVSSLIRAFNSEEHRDGAVVDERLREWNDEPTWDKSALMSIQRELSEFSTSYQQNFNSGHFPSAGPFSSQDTNFYSSEVAAMAHMSHSSAPSFMRSSHSMSAQVNCNSNFFIHSEFSPFRVWRDYNRFPFQHGQVSGFMHCSEYETPMYKELSLEDQQRGLYRGNRHPRSNLAPVVPPAPARSTSTSTMLQKASSVEKRCESELAGHYPHRKRAQSLGANRLPSQRPSTASPTIEMSRRVRDTISSVKALQQKIKMMTAQNITTGVIPDQQELLYSNQNLISISNNAATAAPNVVNSNTSTTPFNISQLLTPFVPAHQEVDFQQYAVSPQPVEHPPVRAESRGATPDVRMSSYKSRATSLLFNLKDNRKRVKSTYSPTKFKGMENMEKSKQPSNQEPRETVIDMPDFPDPYSEMEEPSRTNAAAYQYHNPGMALSSQPASVHTGQYPEYALGDYQPAQMQGQMVHHAGFTGFIPENYPSNQLANGQNLYEDLASFAPYKKDMIDNMGTLGGNVYTLNPSYTETPRLTADNNKSREYLISKANTEQPFNETVGRVFTKVERYEQLQDNKQDYNNVSSQDWWRQTNSQDTEKLSVRAAISPWKQEMRQENLPNKEHKKPGLVSCSASNQLPQWSCSNENQAYHGQQQPLDYKDKNVLQKYPEENEMKGNNVSQNYYRYTDQEYRSQHAFYSAKDQPAAMQETSQRKQYTAPNRQEMQPSLQPIQAKTPFEQSLLSDPDNISAPIIPNHMKDGQLVEVKAEQVMPEPIKAQHTQTELAKAQQWAQVEQPKAEPAKLILAGQTGSEKVTTEEAKSELQERVKQPREKEPERAREDQAEADTARVQKVTVKPRNITGDIREELAKQVKAEQAEAERLKVEHIKTELLNTEQAKMRQAKTEQVTGKRINAEQVEGEQVKTGEAEKEAERIRTEKVNAEQTAAECREADATKTEQMEETKAEQGKTNAAKVEKVKSDHIKAENVREAKDEKDSVQVSKMNAEETAQITAAKDAKLEERKAEKMQERSAKLTTKLTATQLVRSEPDKVEQVKTELAKAKAELAKIKEKMRGDQKEKVRNTTTKEENIAQNNKNEDNTKQDQAAQIQQKDDSLYRNERGADDYDRLREKYGFTNAVSTNKTKESTAENVSTNDFSETQNTSPNKNEAVDKETSNDSPTSTVTAANTGNKEEAQSFSEGSETLYVYSESSKEFKLSSADYCPANADKTTNGDSVTDAVKNDSAEKRETLRQTDGSQQKVSDLAKMLPAERKPKSTEPNVGPAKDLNFTPPKALSQKERAQTKQEILTSKIKAHAEKEISAIKEKGFAKRDGIISKTSIKQLAGSQSVNVRQKPPSLEMSKKPENTVISSTTQKHKMELSGAQNEQIKPISPPSSATTKPAGATTPLADRLHPQAPQNSLKSNSKEPKQAGKESSVLNQEQESQSGITLQNNEQSLTSDQRKEQANRGKTSGGQKENITTDKKKVNPAEPTGVNAAGCELVMTEKAVNKEAVHDNTEPSIGLVLGQKEVPVADDSLQIMGIMVTVRERKPSVSTGQENNSAHKEKKEHSNSEPDKCHPNPDLLLRAGKTSQKDVKSKDIQETEGQGKVRIKSPENEQKTSTSDTRKTQKTSFINAKLQRETQAEPPAKKDVPFTVTVPAKNKAETQPLVCQQDMTSREAKDHTDKSANESSTTNIERGENVNAKVMNTGIKNDAETLIKQDVQPPAKEDKTPVINQPKSSTTDGKRHESTPPKIPNKASSSDNLPLKHNETHTGGNNQDDDSVHIDSIAIRVVPAEPERANVKIVVGKQPITTTTSDVVPANDHKHQHTAPSSRAQKVNNENLTPVSNEKKMKDSVEEKLGVQQVLSSVRKLSESLKNSNHQNSVNATSGTTPAEQPVEGDYFQVQGVTETSNKQHNNRTTVVDASKERELPELLPNKTAVSNESHREGKHEAFVFNVDQGKRKAVESDSKSTQEEDMKRKDWGAQEKLASKHTDGSTERWSNNEKMAANQANHVRKHHIENHPSLSERQSLRNPTRESTLKEKPEVKPKPKEKVSAIPEISALADYARLKVIVSEDREADTVQELPPNKKEGFFPLIQSRHSRRPVFTADPQDLSGKEKGLPNKTEMNAKVNKEPKAPVFPITEKEHQRTGMFKLGDKERQEKILPDNKGNHSVLDNVAKNPNHKDRNNPPTVQTGQTAVGDTQSQVHQGICQPNNHSVLPATSSSLVNMPRSTSESLNKYSFPQSTVGQIHHRTGNVTLLRKDERTEKQDKETAAKAEEGRTDKIKTERTATQQEDTKVKQHAEIKQLSRSEEERRRRDEAMKIKHMIEESRASLAEEEKRASQREEERRAREREAVAAKIKERREKQREAEKIADEERKVNEEEIKAQQREEVRIKETDEERRRNKMQEEERTAKEGLQGAAKEELQLITVQEEQQRRTAEEQQRKAVEEQQRKKAQEKKRLAQEEQQRTAAREEQERRAAHAEQQRKAVEEQKRRLAQEEKQRRATEEWHRRAAQEEQHRRAAQEEQQMRAALEEQQRKAALLEQERRAVEEQQKRVAQEEQQKRAAQEEQQRAAEEKQRRAVDEQQRRAAQEEQQRKKAQEEQQRRAAWEEQQKRAAEEKQRRAAWEEQQRRAAEEHQRKAAHEEQQRRAAEEKQRRAAQEEQQRRAAEEQQRKAAQEEHQRRAAEEQQRKAAQEEQQRRAAEEKQRRAAQEEQQRKAVEEKQRRAAQEEQQRRAAEEQQRRAAQEEQQRRAAEEQQRRAAQEEHQRRAAEEQQRKAAQEEQQRRAAEEKQRRAAQEEQQRRAAEEQQRKAAQEEQQRRATEEQQRRTAQEEQQRRAAEEQQRKAAQEEQQRRAAWEEQQRRAAEEKQKRLAQEEQQISVAQTEQQRTQEQMQAKNIKEKIFSDVKEENKRTQREEKASSLFEEEMIRQEEIKTEQQGRERHYSPDKTRHSEENEAALKEKQTQEQMLAQREQNIQATKKKEEELAVHREQVKASQTEKQRSAAQTDTLQYYAITSTDTERKPRERQLSSPLPFQQRNNPSVLESTEDLASHSRPYRPHAPASPAPSLSRSNTSSPALGPKPSMFRVKDNTTRGSSSIKSVIPRFHKNFGEDFRVGSPMDRRSERGEEQEIMRCSAGTPVYPDTGLNQLGSINESSASSPQDYTVPIPHHRPYSRRSIAMDEEDSRSVVSNMSEGVESFATSVADLADIRGLYDYDRPESACSFSSDVSRSLGKPPAVPPKSEKALRRAKRLTTRRIKKELSKAAETEAEKEVSSILSSSSTEVRSSSRHAVASPHFSPPVSLTHAPAPGSSLSSSQTEHSSSHHSFHASPHATGPISIPVASPHATAPISLPTVSPHATGPASHFAPPKAVAHVSSSPTLHHANHPAPVTQYQVESSYPQSYPLTQRKVLQDPGSGQYFVVDLPVKVKTKTFFDPETGKYVQLNVRESGQSLSHPRQQPQLQSKMQIKAQQQPLSQACPAEKPYVLYQGYHDYPKGYQPGPINNVHPHRSSDSVTLYQQDQQPVREGHIYGYPAPETEQNSEGHRYSPEKTPYMDTVNDTDKTYNRVYSTYGSQESFPECDTNSQLAGSSVCENDTSAHSQYQPRDIITMSELEDFMEVSDW